jgi:hypothetical protein
MVSSSSSSFKLVGSLSIALVALMAIGCGQGEAEDDTSGTEDKFTSSGSSSGGGGESGGDDAGNGSGAQASTLKAQVREVPFTKTLDKCKIDVKQIEVKLDNAAAADAINRELKATEKYNEYLDPTDCASNSFELEGGSTAAFNERGWLSVTVAESSFYEGAAHPANSYAVLNFDLKTGKKVQLNTVVDAEGLKIIAAKCTSILNTSEGVEPGDDFLGDACKKAVETDVYGNPVYAIEGGGLRIHPLSLPHAAFALGAEGALIPWADLKNHITNPVVKAIARQ